MPLPLLWLGAAAASAYAIKALADDRENQQQQRNRSYKPQSLSDSSDNSSSVAIYPSELFKTKQWAKPAVGSVLCCGIGGILDHTGIWVGDNTIIELDGNGLIKPISANRFTQERSGQYIFVACDSKAQPLASELAAQRAINQLYTYRDYHLIENNCHQFIWSCFEPQDTTLTTFKELNRRLALKFDRKVYWDRGDIPEVS